MAIKQIKIGTTVHDIVLPKVLRLGSSSGTAFDGSAEVIVTPASIGALSATGGTLTGSVTITNSSNAQSGEPHLAWKTIGANTPYIGFAKDQTDGTFILCSLKGTNYATGLAIGGGSGNLLWKGVKVATVSDIPSIPTSLKNPNSLTVKGNGTTSFTYDGSAAKTLNIKPGSNVTVSSDTSGNVTIAATNTTYNAATTSAAGLMSAADKTKLDGIATGANAYTLPTASSSTLGGVKTGNNITNSSGTISLTKSNVTSALGYTPPNISPNEVKSVHPTSTNKSVWLYFEGDDQFFKPDINYPSTGDIYLGTGEGSNFKTWDYLHLAKDANIDGNAYVGGRLFINDIETGLGIQGGHTIRNMTAEQALTKLNEIDHNGWFVIQDISLTLGGYTVSYWYGISVTYNENYVVQKLYPIGGARPILIRWKHDGTWNEEWERPPLTVGVEYKTTERYDARVVYQKLINCGACPTSAKEGKAFSHGITGCRPIDITGRLSSSALLLPYVSSGGATIHVSANSNSINIYPSYATSDPGNVMVLLKYYKV